MRHSKEFMAGWLCGFFDGEGSARWRRHIPGKNRTSYFLSVSNTDPELMKKCTEFLDALNIGHTRWSYQGRTPNRKPFATLHICKMSEIKRFSEIVGFLAPHKAIAMTEICRWGDRVHYRHSKFDPHMDKIRQWRRDGKTLRGIVRDLGFPEGSHRALGARLEKEDK